MADLIVENQLNDPVEEPDDIDQLVELRNGEHDEKAESEFSRDSYDEADLDEAGVSAINWQEVEYLNRKGQNRKLFTAK